MINCKLNLQVNTAVISFQNVYKIVSRSFERVLLVESNINVILFFALHVEMNFLVKLYYFFLLITSLIQKFFPFLKHNRYLQNFLKFSWHLKQTFWPTKHQKHVKKCENNHLIQFIFIKSNLNNLCLRTLPQIKQQQKQKT